MGEMGRVLADPSEDVLRHVFLSAHGSKTDHCFQERGELGALFGKCHKHLHGALGMAYIDDFLVSLIVDVFQRSIYVV